MKFFTVEDGGISALGFDLPQSEELKTEINARSEQYDVCGTACVISYDTDLMNRDELIDLLENILACKPEIGFNIDY